ncbi:unnamed protein product [Thelazia callipaeda]|uniref:Tr-type G domain-containing protein n=1 Tax=Thelazia callipaeda TaxID=103827 RepID=A0A0N5CK23_THECL|nr:unnamed protein product [Thelazia callipaeda]
MSILKLSQSPEKRIVENKSLNQLTRADGSSSRLVALNAARNAVKPTVNLIVVGHVDAGKSTLMGHFLYQLGGINERIMHKYKQESAKRGKASFAYAWILDDTQEERERGVTMDVARTSFETEHRKILVLDAPGHKDFIPNMITGNSYADAGILVVNATHGEFETGFDFGGQTREHTILLRSLGVGELLVAVNKLDTVEWSQQRYDELRATLTSFLRKQASYTKVRFIPLSGLHGINLVNIHPLLQWYKGPTLLQAIDELQVPAHSCDHPFRAVINNINKISSSAISVNIKIEAGFIECKEKVYIMPDVYHVIVKVIETCSTKDIGFAGDNALVTLIPISSIESDSVSIGHVLCRGGEECLIPGKKYRVRVVVFDTAVPIFRGTKVELFAHCLVEPCTITHLIAELNKSTGQVIRQKPRMLTKNMSGVIEIVTERAVNLELYSVCKALGRVTFRRTGQTIAAGIIEQKVD